MELNEDEVESGEAQKEDPVHPKPVTKEPEICGFLRSLKLDMYQEAMIEQGADKMGQLIYVDDTIIDQLCNTVKMKIVHAGVFKRAIRECRLSSRMETSSIQQHDRLSHLQKYEPRSMDHLISTSMYSNFQDPAQQFIDRRKYMHPCDSNLTMPQLHHNQSSLLHLYAAAQAAHETTTLQNRTYNTPFGQTDTSRNLSNVNEPNSEDKRQPQGDLSAHPSITSSQRDNNSPQEFLDGSYYIEIYNRSVKFPPAVRRLTILDRIDQERRDTVRRGSQIYGRDDTKRKHNELTQLEIFMNEIAYEICLRDFTYMISRQKLLGLVREIIKDNQIQLSGHHNYTGNPTFTTYVVNGKNKDKLKAVSVSEAANENISTTPTENTETTDYETILYHKLNREWPQAITRERRKYLGRRAANFEVINGVLYYSKDNKKRRWVHLDTDLKQIFNQFHVDPDSGCHYSREVTIDRVVQNFYCKNMFEHMTKFYINCDSCQKKHSSISVNSPYATRSTRVSLTNDEPNHIPVVDSNLYDNLILYEAQLNSRSKRKPADPSVNSNTNPPVKKSRKSVPQRLAVVENVEETGEKNIPEQSTTTGNEESAVEPKEAEVDSGPGAALLEDDKLE